MTTSNYIVHIKHNKGTEVSKNLLGDLKGMVSKFDGKVKDDLSLVPGFTVALPNKVGESFKHAADAWGKKNDVSVNVEKDSEVHAL